MQKTQTIEVEECWIWFASVNAIYKKQICSVRGAECRVNGWVIKQMVLYDIVCMWYISRFGILSKFSEWLREWWHLLLTLCMVVYIRKYCFLIKKKKEWVNSAVCTTWHPVICDVSDCRVEYTDHSAHVHIFKKSVYHRLKTCIMQISFGSMYKAEKKQRCTSNLVNFNCIKYAGSDLVHNFV